MPTVTTVHLPVGPTPGWEQSENEDALRNPAESLVILQSLRQSREQWLSSTFPQFSSKVRGGKAPHNSPPPHTIQTRGKCDLEIGPHIFPETVFYEVHYLPSQSQLTPRAHLPTAGVQSATPYSGAYTPHAQSSHPASTGEGSSVLGLPTSSSPLISSLTKVTKITPELINRVNSAASSNPILANLVQLAASQVATPEQLKTLGLLIQSLASPESAQLASQSLPIFQSQPNQASPVIPPHQATTSNSPIKEFDLVIEFRETPSERWIFPRGPVVFDQDKDLPGTSYDTVVKTIIPFDSLVGNPIATNQGPSAQSSSPIEKPHHVATFRLRRTPLAVWDTLSRWAGGEEKMQRSRNLIDALDQTDRVYLGHRLSQGPLLSQLQTLTAPTFNLKTLKPGPPTATRAKRTTSRKADSSASKKPDNVVHQPSKPTASKRRKLSQPHLGPVPIQIQCISCKQTDVPLILGGRYCRPCVESGHGISASQPYTFSSYVSPSVKIPESAEERQSHSSQTPSHIPLSIHTPVPDATVAKIC